MCFSTVLTVALFLLEKTAGVVVFCLLIIAGSLVYPVTHFFSSARVRFLILALMCLMLGLFGMYVWPHKDKPRPHLHVTQFSWKIPSAGGGPAFLKVTFANNGNSPTEYVNQVGGMAYFVVPENEPAAQTQFERELLEKESSAPSTVVNSTPNEIPVGTDRSYTLQSPIWSQHAVEQFIQSKALLYAAGTIHYSAGKDTFFTRYCVFTDVSGNTRFCGTHNQEQ